MKNILIFCTLLSLLTACNLEETNVNPNDPLDVPLELLLPPALESAAEIQSGEAAVIAGIFAQYFTGTDNRALPVEKYLLDESFNMNPLWQDIYNTSLTTFHLIIEKAEAQNAPHYAGVAKVMQALTLGTTTALWGDVPYTEAFVGAENLNPRYDTQEQIYADVQRLLDEAVVDLSAEESVFSPGADDVIYNGDLQNWQRAAYALQARYALHLVKRDPNAAATALTALAQSFTEPAQDLVYTYGFTDAEFNPWYLYFQNTPYIEIDDYFSDLLENDPRKDNLIRRSFGLSRVGDFYGGEFATVPLITYSEVKFLEAEALLRTQAEGAEEAARTAVRTHTTAVTDGEITADSIAAFAEEVIVFTGDFETDLQSLIQQKYIQHFTQIEGWTDYRRTGYPELPVNAEGDNPQNPGGDIPRRFIYPQNERLFNENFPAANPNLQDRVWWD